MTGGTGFLGSAIIPYLLLSGHEVSAGTRQLINRNNLLKNTNIKWHVINDINRNTYWLKALEQVDVILHCAARVHILKEKNSNPLNLYREVNVEGTIQLARQAASVGVKRFIYVSTVKVNGEESELNIPIKADDIPHPIDYYGVSKWEAEQSLKKISEETGMDIVIIRPPLIYGPGVKANFATLIKFINLGLPLPFGQINNSRSLVSVDNLIDLLLICITHKKASGHTFMVSDGEDISTTQLILRTADAMEKKIRLYKVPIYLLKNFGKLIGRVDMMQRLCGTLQVDIQKTRDLLEWKPRLTLDEGLKKAVLNLQIKRY